MSKPIQSLVCLKFFRRAKGIRRCRESNLGLMDPVRYLDTPAWATTEPNKPICEVIRNDPRVRFGSLLNVGHCPRPIWIDELCLELVERSPVEYKTMALVARADLTIFCRSASVELLFNAERIWLACVDFHSVVKNFEFWSFSNSRTHIS